MKTLGSLWKKVKKETLCKGLASYIEAGLR